MDVRDGGALDQRIEVRGVECSYHSKSHEVHALGPIDLSVGADEFVCIVGPSGCGKTTLLRIMAGLVNPTAGEVVLRGLGASRSMVSMVFQDYSIFPWKTVEANVRLGLDLAGISRSEAKERARHWIDKLHLTEFAGSLPRALSGGMRQRVSIARALAVEPEILLMDEPFAALDAQLRAVLQEELLALWQNDRRAVVFITHSLDEALLLGDRVVVMSGRPGTVLAEFEVPFARPRGREVRADPRFGALEQEIWELLRTQIKAPVPA